MDRRGHTEFTRLVPVTEVDWWIDVYVDATWEDLSFQLMRVESDGMAWGYIRDDHRCTGAHAVTAELQGGRLEWVDRGEIHLGVPLECLANVRESVSDRKASALEDR